MHHFFHLIVNNRLQHFEDTLWYELRYLQFHYFPVPLRWKHPGGMSRIKWHNINWRKCSDCPWEREAHYQSGRTLRKVCTVAPTPHYRLSTTFDVTQRDTTSKRPKYDFLNDQPYRYRFSKNGHHKDKYENLTHSRLSIRLKVKDVRHLKSNVDTCWSVLHAILFTERRCMVRGTRGLYLLLLNLQANKVEYFSEMFAVSALFLPHRKEKKGLWLSWIWTTYPQCKVISAKHQTILEWPTQGRCSTNIRLPPRAT